MDKLTITPDQPVNIQVKRIYDPPGERDGFRVFVDRLWPRGLKKSELKIDKWFKDIAPSTTLRKWFNHDPAKWDEFVQDYKFELNRGKAVGELLECIKKYRKITLLYAARDEKHNNGLALKLFLDAYLQHDESNRTDN